jgi:hypothetical protein
MFNLLDQPLLILLATLLAFWLSARIGSRLGERWLPAEAESREDFKFILGGTLTLLALIVGFVFSMAVGRYDQRKNLEEQEANAIGTEFVRVDLLSPADASKARGLLRRYLDQRIVFYTTRDEQLLRQVDAQTARLQAELWTVVAAHATAQPTPPAALVAAGMNDVLNSQGYSQAAWWNRIPAGAWALMITIAIFCNLLVGFGAGGRHGIFLLVLPIALSITMFLIADIDSPRSGVIHVRPQNLLSTAESLRAP